MVGRILIGIVIGAVVIAAGLFLFVRAELPKYRTAFLYAFGPYEFVRTAQDLSAQRAAEGGLFNADSIRQAYPDWQGDAFLNRHIHGSDLADHTLRTVTTPNTDTLYTSAVLELSSTPVELVVPAVGSRYVSVALMDVFTDQFAHIGPRETSGEGGVYWIMGPEDLSLVPEGVTEIRATGNDVWLLARTFVSGESDLSAARAAQQGISVRPVFPDRPEKPFATQVTEISDAENFVAVVNEALARNPSHAQTVRGNAFAELGLGEGASQRGHIRRMWALVASRAEAAVTEQINQQLSAQKGWSNPPKNIGFYADDDITRSAIALIGFGALRQQDAIYYRMTKTEDGAPLDGAQTYQMVLPKDVPAEAFWSVALYGPDETGRFYLYETATGRHALNSGTDDLVVREDGSILLEMGPTAPRDANANWLPTPDGPFAAFLRVYLPTPQAVESGWVPPEVFIVE